MAEGDLKANNESFKNPQNYFRYDLAQNIFLNLNSSTSLQHLTLTYISTQLWRKYFFKEMYIISLPHRKVREKFKLFENKIMEEISVLGLSLWCRDSLKASAKSVGKRLLDYFLSQRFLKLPFWIFGIHWNSIQWTHEGTINKLKTAKYLIESPKLSMVEKYVIACFHCLETHVSNLLERLPDNFIYDFIADSNYRLVWFWTFRFKRDNDKYLKVIKRVYKLYINFTNYNIRYILRWAVKHGNEVAVQYMWENFADEMVKGEVADLATQAFRDGHPTISFYFLSVMSEAIFAQRCTDEVDFILKVLQSDQRWKNLTGPTAKYMIQFHEEMGFENELHLVMFLRDQKVLDRDHYITVLSEYLNRLDIWHETKLEIICKKLLTTFLCLEDENILHLMRAKICNTVSFEDKKRILYNSGKTLIMDFIKCKKIYLIDIFLKEMLHYRTEEIYFFKKSGFTHSSINICFELVVKDCYGVVDEYLDLMYADEKGWFKLIVAQHFEMLFDLFFKTFFPTNAIRLLDKVKKFVSWCFDGDEEKITKFKELMFNEGEEHYFLRHKLLKVVYGLINLEDTQLAENYLSWAIINSTGSLNSKKVALSKKLWNLYTEDIILGKGSFCCIKKFLIAFLSEEELENLKEDMKSWKGFSSLPLICKTLLEKERDNEITELLNWYFSSDDDLNAFKNSLSDSNENSIFSDSNEMFEESFNHVFKKRKT